MKLLIYSHYLAPSIGGVETIVLSLAYGLEARRDAKGVREFQITVVTQTPAGDCDDSKFPFCVVRRPDPLRLWRLIREQDKLLLAGPAILPLVFSLLRRKDTVLTHHGYQAVCPNGMLFQFSRQADCPGHFAAGEYLECWRCNAPELGWLGSFRLLLLTFVRRSLAARATTNVGVSEHVASRIALPHLHVIRNAVAEQPSRAVITSMAANRQSEIRFAYLGRLVTEKGVRILLQAAAALAQQGLTPPILIIGDGPERPALERQKTALKLGENVSFLGFQRGASLDETLKQVSVLVMPSLCQDVAPLAVLEMMMQRRVIIGSKIGGLAEQLGETGLTFAPGDAQGLAQRMMEVLENPSQLEVLGRSAYERAARHYSLQRMVDAYRDPLGSNC